MAEETKIDLAYRNVLNKRFAQWAFWGAGAGIIILFTLLARLVYIHVKSFTVELLWDVVMAALSGMYVGGFLGAVFGYLSIAFPFAWAKSDDERWRVLLRAERYLDDELE